MPSLEPKDWLLALTILTSIIGPFIAAKFQRDGKKMESSVELAKMALGEKERFQADVMAELREVKATSKEQGAQINALNIEIASLTAKVTSLEFREQHLTTENKRLNEENKELRIKNERLDQENEAQGNLLSHMRGRLQTLDPTYKDPSSTLGGST